MIIKYGKCMNCGKNISFKEFVCKTCYMIYFQRVREYLYKHPLANINDLRKATKLPMELLNLYYKNGDIQKVVDEIEEKKQIEIKNNESKLEDNKKLQLINELEKQINTTHKVVDSTPRMRFLKDNHKR